MNAINLVTESTSMENGKATPNQWNESIKIRVSDFSECEHNIM